MQLFALTGLVRKAEFAAQMAARLEKAVVLDEITLDELPQALKNSPVDHVILPVADSVHPDELLAALDGLHDAGLTVESRVIALIDDRTCDCFPNLRRLLEDYADVTLNYPFDVERALNHA